MNIKDFIEKPHRIQIKTTCKQPELVPSYATTGAAGADVKANIQHDVVIPAGSSALIPTGLFFEIPEGYEIQVRPRSGLALKSQITVLNTPGTIDSDYRGEVCVILMNHGKNDFTVTPGMRVAQIVVAKVTLADFIFADTLAVSDRGHGGFGHSGTH
jgi:dUTP pyrophosphatase